MGSPGVELIVGARNDPQWGSVLLVGFGGVLAEAIQDVRLLAAEPSRTAIEQELYKLRCGALLRGFRGVTGARCRRCGRCHSLASDRFMRTSPEIAEIDINPLVLYAKGSGVIALDALISVVQQLIETS